MATIDLSFRIDQTRGTVFVNDLPAALAAPVGLAANISFVSFAKGSGQIIYNDRPVIPELFTDPSPYQSYLNQWITAKSQLATNPLTLAQAQAVKCALVNAIYTVKRTAPVTVTVSGTAYQWDASDAAVGRMSPLASLAYISDLDSVISDANSKIGAMLTSIDSEMATLVTGIDNNVTAFGSFITSLQNNLNSWVTTLNTNESPIPGWVAASNMTVPSSGMSNVSWPPVSFSNISSITAPTIQLLPYGGTALVTLQPSDVKAIMQAIASQYATESLKNEQKQAAVNALTLMQDVINYDATTGW